MADSVPKMASEEKKMVIESFGSGANEFKGESAPRSFQAVNEFPFQPIDII